MEPAIVLGADKLQGAAVQPGDQQRALLGQAAVDGRRPEAAGPRPYGKPRAAGVLPLDGEQPPGDGDGIGQRRAAEGL